jgi:hypothetical protein
MYISPALISTDCCNSEESERAKKSVEAEWA